MKSAIFSILSAIVFISCSGVNSKPVVKNKPQVLAATTEPKDIFTSHVSSDSASYFISDSVEVLNGKDEYVTVFFHSSFDKKMWDEFKKNFKDEKAAFWRVAKWLTVEANFLLKNRLSFEPMKEQFLYTSDKPKVFASMYKLWGRNGYGNMIEGKELVFLKPSEMLSKQ